jgi:hypothetical protein
MPESISSELSRLIIRGQQALSEALMRSVLAISEIPRTNENESNQRKAKSLGTLRQH